MKQQHAIPVAIAAWFLMSPPVMRIPRYGTRVNPSALLHYWKIRGTYGSPSDCQAARLAMLAAAEANPEQPPDPLSDLSSSDIVKVTRSLVCVSDDDPRLDRRW